MTSDRPETSTVREALELVRAFDLLLVPSREGGLLDPDDAARAVIRIIRSARELRPHQIDDVVEHLHERYIGDDGATLTLRVDDSPETEEVADA